jgi:membrane protein DedA with SNARE-associated domain
MLDRLIDFLLNFYGPTPYLLILGVLFACGMGLPIPEDITLFAAGVLAYYGVVNIWLMIVVALLGVLAGDTMMYLLGSGYGRKLTKTWFFKRLIPDQRLNAVKVKFHERGNKLIFAARFMPGLRAPIFFTSGLLHLPYRVFMFYDGSAAIISVPAIIGAVYIFGDELDAVVRFIERLEHGIFLVILALVLAILIKWYLMRRK